MAGALSEQLAQRYSLQLTGAWSAWFDDCAGRGFLVGQYHAPIDVADLLEPAPLDLWPGFMLPDMLPIVSNDYGDWWCIRVGRNNEILEVVQWLHGGGDWLPVGATIAEAALWDYLQRWRGPAIGAQPASFEYPERNQPDPALAVARGELENWLVGALDAQPDELRHLLDTAERGEYRPALEYMLSRNWSASAVACELTEVALQGSLTLLADNRLAKRCGINWAPEYTSWLFDTTQIPGDAQTLLSELNPEVRFQQDWRSAAMWAERTRVERPDLCWAGDIAGWAAERNGDAQAAIERYFANRHASAFTDQSVRLRSHWFPERYGKFSTAQLARLQDQLSPEQKSDPYLQLLWHEPAQRTRAAIRSYWLAEGEQALDAGAFAKAYTFFTNAGWDLGAERLSDYVEILERLANCAELAGWSARAQVASTHAECLRRRLPPE
jgi:hypothetical protein